MHAAGELCRQDNDIDWNGRSERDGGIPAGRSNCARGIHVFL